MSRHILLVLSMFFILTSSWVHGNNFKSSKPCLLQELKQNAQAYYNAVNEEDKKTMYSFESEEYQKKEPMADYEPQLLEMKKRGRFNKLSVKSVELKDGDVATVIVEFLIFNKMVKVWYTDGSFLQSWKCPGGKWFVNTPPTVILLR